jgi:hypothetical protein
MLNPIQIQIGIKTMPIFMLRLRLERYVVHPKSN